MADRTDFEHIRVTRADDDVVIVAGARNAGRSAKHPAANASVSENVVQGQMQSTPRDKDASALSPRAQAGQEERSDDAYRATTLEDIERSRMPLAQRIVVGLALVAVAAFVVWRIVAG